MSSKPAQVDHLAQADQIATTLFRQGRRETFQPRADNALRELGALGASLMEVELYLPAVCRRHLGAEPRTITPLAEQGTARRLYRAELVDGRAVVARFNGYSQRTRDHGLLLDRWAATVLPSAGLPALAVHAVDLSRTLCPWDYALLDPAPGTPLRDLERDEDTLRPHLANLGAFLASLHGIAVEGYGLVAPDSEGQTASGTLDSWPAYLDTQLDRHLAVCRELRVVSAAEAEAVRRAFDSTLPELDGIKPALLHGDPSSGNVFVQDGQIACLLDWENALAGDPVYEVALWAAAHPESRWSAFLEGYSGVRPLPADFTQRFWLYFLRCALARLVAHHHQGLAMSAEGTLASGFVRRALDGLAGQRCAA